jgi:hypothetical protein
MEWGVFWQEVRGRVDACPDRPLTLPVSEIKTLTGTDQSIDRPWWWDIMCDPAEIGSTPLADYGLACQPHIEMGRVTSVTFSRL